MSLFRLDASIRTEGSHSREIADIVEAEWRQNHRSGEVVHRDLGLDPIPSTVWAEAVSAPWTPEDSRTPAQRAATALAAESADQLLAADAFLFAVPLYNYGVSQHFKTWIDLVLTDPRTGPGATEPALAGKSAVLVTVRGGGYGPGTPREGWDHATDWMRRILSDFWQLDLRVVQSELTLAPVVPALAEFIGLAEESRKRAEESAREHGRTLQFPIAV